MTHNDVKAFVTRTVRTPPPPPLPLPSLPRMMRDAALDQYSSTLTPSQVGGVKVSPPRWRQSDLLLRFADVLPLKRDVDDVAVIWYVGQVCYGARRLPLVRRSTTETVGRSSRDVATFARGWTESSRLRHSILDGPAFSCVRLYACACM